MAPLTLVSFASLQADAAVKLAVGSLGYRVRMLRPALACAPEPIQGSDALILLLGDTRHPREQVLSALAAEPSKPSLALVVGGEGRWDREIIDRCSDCAHWPCGGDELAFRVGRLCRSRTQRAAIDQDPLLCEALAKVNLIGQSRAFREVVRQLQRLVRCEAPVLIAGETGTGKELVARALHYLGERAAGPFVPVNCGALPDHLIENELFGHERGAYTDAKSTSQGAIGEAAGGTLFLDEVEALSPKAQTALLRFLNDREYRPLGGGRARRADVRVIAASNADLRQLSEARAFRSDLYYRLDILSIRMPPLRERAGDVTLLAGHFVDRFQRQYGLGPMGLDPRCLSLLEAHGWPGNVRELENLVHRQVLLTEEPWVFIQPDGPDVTPARLPAESSITAISFADAKARAIESFERRYLTHLMHETQGNVSQAARRAAKERRALGKLLKKYSIPPAADN